MQKKIQLPKTDKVEPVDKTLDELYEILPQYQRFDEGMHMNLRRVWVPKWKKGRIAQRKVRQSRIEKGMQGFSIKDYALVDDGGVH